MNQWHAIRTSPGAQHPQREYAVETTRSVKGYRIVPSLDPDISAVERSLANNGFTHYMPVERRVVRDRRKINAWTTRRFPLLPGYAFVHGVTDFRLLEDTPGVSEVIRNNGEPFAVKIADIETLLAIEAENAAEIERRLTRQKAMDAAQAAHVTRSTAKVLFPSGSRVEITAGHGIGLYGFVIGSDRGARLKVIADTLEALGSISIPVASMRLVA